LDSFQGYFNHIKALFPRWEEIAISLSTVKAATAAKFVMTAVVCIIFIKVELPGTHAVIVSGTARGTREKIMGMIQALSMS
jgi:hypothetical protein